MDSCDELRDVHDIQGNRLEAGLGHKYTFLVQCVDVEGAGEAGCKGWSW